MIAKNQHLTECQQLTNNDVVASSATTTNIDSSHFSEKKLHSKKNRPTKTIPRKTTTTTIAIKPKSTTTTTIVAAAAAAAMKEPHPRHKQHQQQHRSYQQQQQRRRLQRFRQQQQRKRCSGIFKNIKIHKNRKDILTFLKANYKYKRRSRSSIRALPVRHRMWCTKHCSEHAVLQTKSDNEKMYFNLINLSSAVVVIVANFIDRRWFASASASDDRDDGADSAAASMLDVDGVNNDDVNDDSDETSCQRNYDKLSTLVGQTHQRQQQQQQQRLQQKQQQPPHQYQQRHQHQRQQQQQHSLRQRKLWLQRLFNGMSQQPIYGPRQRRRTSSTSDASRLSSRLPSQPSDRRTQVMPIFMTLFIALALSGRCAVEGGACWQKTLSNGKCNEIFSLNITRIECCSTNPGFSYTDRDLSSVEYFFATTIGGGMECAPCLESCKNIRCGLNKKCAKRKGRPKCICALECGAAARTQRRAKVFRGTQYQQQHPPHPHHHQAQQQQLQLHQQPHHSTSSQLQHHSRQRHLETAVIFGKSARDIRSLSSETHSQNVESEDAVAARRMSTAAAVGAASDRHGSSQRKMIAVVQSQARAQSKREPKEHRKLIIVEPRRTEEAGGAKTTTRRLQVISNVNNNNNHHHRNSNSKNNNNNKQRKKSEKERVHKQDQSIKIRTLHKNKKTTTATTTTTTEEKANEKKGKKKKRKEETVMMELDAIREEVGKKQRGSTTTSEPSSRRKPNTNNNNSNNNNNNNHNGNNDLQQITNFDANNTKLQHIYSNGRQRFQDASNRDQQQQHGEQQEKPHQKQQQRQQHAGRHHPLRKRKKKQHNEAKDQNADTTTTLTVMSGSEIATAAAAAAATTTSRRREQSPPTTTTTKMSSTPFAHSSASEDQPRLLNRGSSFATSSLAISSASSGSTAAAAALATSSAATAKASSSSSGSLSSLVTTIALLKGTEASSTSSSSSSSSSVSAARSSVSWSPSLSSSSSATAVTIADINGNSNTGNSSSNNRSLINSSDDLTFDERIYEKFNLHGFPSQPYKFTQLESIHHSSHHHHHHHPVCGTDGRTYNTECQLKKRACRTDNADLIVAYHGHCKTTCNGVKCLNGLTCVEDHYTIPHCIACRIDCPLDDVDVDGDGHKVNNNADDDAAEIDASRAVCGVDGKTYRSVCDINRMICKIGRSIGVAYPGPCRDDRVSCHDISCGPKRTCLVDLLTHEPRCVSCRYKCARKRRPVSLRFEEGKICGVNKRTYNSWCEMRKDSCATGLFIDIKSLGECQK